MRRRCAIASTRIAELKAKYGDAWDQVAKARAALPPYNLERVFFESGLGLYTQYFTLARTLVRWADESAKPNGQRLPEYSDARKAAIERQMGSEAPIYPGVEQAKLEAGLAVMQQMLGADNALVKQILAGKTPKARAAELVAGTKLGDAGDAQGAVRRRQGRGRRLEGSVHRAGAARRRARPRAAHQVRQRGAGRRARCLLEDRAGGVRDRRAMRPIPTARSRCACRTAR